MANQPNSNDPYRANLTDDDIRRQPRLEGELQADPVLTERSAGGTRIAMFAIAIAVVLGALFYGLNNTTVNQAGNTPANQTAQQAQPANPAAPAGVRDVTPRSNSQPGMTTGAAPSTPSPSTTTPPATTAPAGKQ
jgi:hypothetical protein